MRKSPLVKLVFAVFIMAVTLFGIGQAPARAHHCPLAYDSCVMVQEVCDENGCCCEYVNVENPEIICPTWC